MEMSPVSNFKEDKYLLEFDELQKIIDTIEDTTPDLEYHEQNVREKLEKNKVQEMKKQEECEHDIQKKMEERKWTKEN